MKKSIVWLASYPKSGNTWTRIFLANYLINGQKPVPINEVHRFGMGDSIPKTYHMVAGHEIDVRDVDLTLKLRGKVLRGIVANNADVNLVKTHNIATPAYGVDLIPDNLTRSAVYIVRNPLDMVLSYARHYGLSHAEVVEAIGRNDNSNFADHTTVAQFLGSWSDHVESWTQKTAYPVCVLRYEDMLHKPLETFAKLVEHLGLPLDDERLERSIKFSSFAEVKKQEKKLGFKENPGKSKSFFNKGTSEQWKSDLSPELVQKVRRMHRKTMKKYEYL